MKKVTDEPSKSMGTMKPGKRTVLPFKSVRTRSEAGLGRLENAPPAAVGLSGTMLLWERRRRGRRPRR